MLHYREGSRPLTVAPTAGQPIRRMLPWSTCGHTQGLVRIAPAKQYRLQLHVTTNVRAHSRGASDVKNVTRAPSPRRVQRDCWASSFGQELGAMNVRSYTSVKKYPHACTVPVRVGKPEGPSCLGSSFQSVAAALLIDLWEPPFGGTARMRRAASPRSLFPSQEVPGQS